MLNGCLKVDVVCSFQCQHFSGLGRGCHLQRKLVQDATDLADLGCIALSEDSLAQIKIVLKPDTNMASIDGTGRHERCLMPPRGQNGPVIVLPKQPVGNSSHVQEVFDVWPDSSQYSKDGLNKEGWFDEPPINEMGKVVEMSNVVALVFESRSAAFSQLIQDGFDVRKCVSENTVSGTIQVWDLPIMLPLIKSVQSRIEAEVH